VVSEAEVNLLVVGAEREGEGAHQAAASFPWLKPTARWRRARAAAWLRCLNGIATSLTSE